MIPFIDAYEKALKVIDSCENREHTDGAKNFINNFFRSYSIPKNTRLGTMYDIPETVSDAYQRLLIKHAEKRALLGV